MKKFWTKVKFLVAIAILPSLAGCVSDVLPGEKPQLENRAFVPVEENQAAFYLRGDAVAFRMDTVAPGGQWSLSEEGILSVSGADGQIFSRGKVRQKDNILTVTQNDSKTLYNSVTVPLPEGSWQLSELATGNFSADAPLRQVNLIFMNDGNVAGCGGVNRLMGSYQLSNGNELKFGDFARTMMAGPDLEFEDEFLKLLASVDGYMVVPGKALGLYKGNTLLMTFVPMAEEDIQE